MVAHNNESDGQYTRTLDNSHREEPEQWRVRMTRVAGCDVRIGHNVPIHIHQLAG